MPSPQPESNADENDGGANAYDCEDGPEGPYCATTRHESRNGLGDGEGVGRPAAGSVGRADNKKDNDVLLLTGAGLATIGGLLLTRRRPGRAGAHVRRD